MLACLTCLGLDMIMLESRVPVFGERLPEQLLLSSELQYKIAASSALLEMMIRMSEPYRNDPEKPLPPGDQEIIISIGTLAASDNPISIESYIQHMHEAAKRNMANSTRGVDPEMQKTSAVHRIGTKLQIIDNDLRLTNRFAAAVGFRMRRTDKSWGDMYDSNNMARLNSAKGDVLEHFAPTLTPLTTNGTTATAGLVQFIHDAEFWIGHYDPARR